MRAAEPDPDAEIGAETLQRVSRRLIPFLFVLYIFSFLDRANVGFAGLQMNRDLEFSSSVFGFGAGVFFISYSLFEVPSNLLLVRVGVGAWIGRIMISWGIISTAMMFVETPAQFYVLRFLLGAAEAGFFPAVLYYLSRWFPRRLRVSSSAMFMMAIPLSNAVGGPASGLLLGLDGLLGLQGWQWVFLVEGVPSIGLGVLAFHLLPETPREATWLSDAQRSWLLAELEKETVDAGNGSPLRAALASPAIWLLGFTQLLVTSSGYAYLFWAPTLIRDGLRVSELGTGMIAGGVACASAVVLYASARRADRTGRWARHAGGWAALKAMCCLGVAILPTVPLQLLALAAMQVLGGCFLPPFMAIPTALLHGRALAAGLALINSIGALGGFLGPVLVGFEHETARGPGGAFLIFAAMGAAAALVCWSFERDRRWLEALRWRIS